MQYNTIFICFLEGRKPWLTYGAMCDDFEFTCSEFKVMSLLAKEWYLTGNTNGRKQVTEW